MSMQIPLLSTLLPKMRPSVYDDFGDRLNYHYTPILFGFIALLLSAKQYVAEPIHCWFPVELKTWKAYIENFCFVRGTYLVPLLFKAGPTTLDMRTSGNRTDIGYYQWVPIALAVHALAFYLPYLLWTFFIWQSGINLKFILKCAEELTSKMAFKNYEERKMKQTSFYRFIKDTLDMRRGADAHSCTSFFRLTLCKLFGGACLTMLYLITKLIYLGNTALQFVLIDSFLGGGFTGWGFKTINDLVSFGHLERESAMFPRSSMCDMQILQLGNVHNHTFQCVLLVNILNEKAYLLLWFWLVGVFLLTFLNGFYWLYIGLAPWRQRQFVYRLLSLRFSTLKPDDVTFLSFVSLCLRADGVLILRFISNHFGFNCAVGVVDYLFRDFNNGLPKAMRGTFKRKRRESEEDLKKEKDKKEEEKKKDKEDGTKNKDEEGCKKKQAPSAPSANDDTMSDRTPPVPPPKPKLMTRHLSASGQQRSFQRMRRISECSDDIGESRDDMRLRNRSADPLLLNDTRARADLPNQGFIEELPVDNGPQGRSSSPAPVVPSLIVTVPSEPRTMYSSPHRAETVGDIVRRYEPTNDDSGIIWIQQRPSHQS